MPTIVVRHPRDLTKDWAQRVVNQHDPEIGVAHVDIVFVDIGTTTRVKVNVKYNAFAKLLKQWFVKLLSLAWQARLITTLPRLLHTEVRFYNEVAPSVAVNVPHFLAAESQIGKGATLVLADLSAFDTTLGHPRDALDATQAAKVVVQLAKIARVLLES